MIPAGTRVELTQALEDAEIGHRGTIVRGPGRPLASPCYWIKLDGLDCPAILPADSQDELGWFKTISVLDLMTEAVSS